MWAALSLLLLLVFGVLWVFFFLTCNTATHLAEDREIALR